jgi:MarR family transcriptional regulator, organic hydroperoxide resistance regulator
LFYLSYDYKELGTMTRNIFSIDESLGFWIYRMHTQSVAVLKKAFQDAGHDITPEQWGLMVRLKENQGINQSKLGEKAYKDRHNATRIIRQLERRGLIERRPDEIDKRANNLFITETGQDVLDTLVQIVMNHYTGAFKGLPAEDLRTMRRILEHIINNLSRIEPAYE